MTIWDGNDKRFISILSQHTVCIFFMNLRERCGELIYSSNPPLSAHKIYSPLFGFEIHRFLNPNNLVFENPLVIYSINRCIAKNQRIATLESPSIPTWNHPLFQPLTHYSMLSYVHICTLSKKIVMTFQDHHTENGIKHPDFTSFIKSFIISPPSIREHLTGNSDISAIVCIRRVSLQTHRTKQKKLPLFVPKSHETSD